MRKKNEELYNKLSTAILYDDSSTLEEARELIKHGADVNATIRTTGLPLLFLTIQSGHIEATKLLLDNKASVKTCGWNPLREAIRNGHAAIVELLLQAGADVNDRYKDNITPLHFTAKYGMIKIANILLKHEADVNAVDKHGSTPLDYVIQRKQRYSSELYKNAIELFIFNIAKLGVIDPNINNKGSKKNKDIIEGSEELKSLYEENKQLCQEELKKLESVKIEETEISYYDILMTKGSSKLASYAGNKNLQKAFKSDEWKKEFPIYANDIEKQWKKGVETLKFYQTLKKFGYYSLYFTVPALITGGICYAFLGVQVLPEIGLALAIGIAALAITAGVTLMQKKGEPAQLLSEPDVSEATQTQVVK
ncbi:ankyrin repeat domain-containing protein [Wolbachia endosymbiont of Pentidionis agamae]|uniref:ankyrin repeat domain-containing protein n=1 Tax=Wolbachia endosymbiont of Pentidionis agamae TaxID=3110435 RepID=UPI002FCF76C0